MIFKKISRVIKRYFDVFCYILSAGCINYGAFCIFKPLLWFTLALSFGAAGWLSEWLSDQQEKGGGS